MFNPRAVPIMGVDEHLPAVDSARFAVCALRHRFAAPPPWQPEDAPEWDDADRPKHRAAVLLAIVMRQTPTVLLTRRAAHLPTHAGQVAFPGGKLESADAGPVDAALREAWEEVGLSSADVEVLGCLPDYTTSTAFVVTPVVALVPEAAELAPNPQEVADTFEVPLDYLMNPAHHNRHEIWLEGQLRQWFSMPYHDGVGERYIWGATAGMLRNLYRLLSA